MCIIVLAYQCHPHYPLIILANRDEYFNRPAKQADFWPDQPHIYAGRDLVGLGTWLGVSLTGKIGMLTNYREPKFENSQLPSRGLPSGGLPSGGPPSRGLLVQNYLASAFTPVNYLQSLQLSASQFNGFNLIVGNYQHLYYFSNQTLAITKLNSGIHGLSNGLLNTPWPKVELAKRLLKMQLATGQKPVLADLFAILANTILPADAELPSTGLSLERERQLGAIFIQGQDYGTRASTVIMVDNNQQVLVAEKTFFASLADPIMQQASFRLQA